MSTHWFHDHMLDYTAQNVYKGNAAMMNYYSAIDRGREPKATFERDGLTDPAKPSEPAKLGYACHYANPNNANLCLPSGSGLDWGNRDYDVNLLVADKAWDATGQLKFNIFNTGGFLGDRMTVNWLYKPYMEVRPRRYRFRILNGSVSRFFKIAIVKEVVSGGTTSYVKIPYHMIANDGNIMQHAIPFPNAQSPDALPEQSIAERYDIIVDFKDMAQGTKLYMVNILEHTVGEGPSKIIPLADVLSGRYKVQDGNTGDPAVGKFLEFRVNTQGYTGTDLSMNPADYVEGKKQMIPLNKPTTQELKDAVQRTFVFGKKVDTTDAQPWTIKTDTDLTGLNADPHRISAAPELPAIKSNLGKVEIWHFSGGTGGWSHPIHVHFEEGQILYRGGVAPPIWEKYARKDVYRIGSIVDSKSSVDIAIRFREFAGTYVEHCHNTQHEDKAMLLRWDLQNSGQTVSIPTPEPDWDGVQYQPSIYAATYKTGDVAAKQKFVLPDGTSTASTGNVPTAVADGPVNVPVSTAAVIDVLANDVANGSALIPSTVAVSNVSLGTTSTNTTTGKVTFTAGTTTGTGGFDYSVANTNGTSSLTHVNVAVIPTPVAGAAPTANADGPFNTIVNGSVAITVLANDLNNGSALIPSSVKITNATLGTTSVDTTGKVTFTATAAGTGGFDYSVANANGTSASAHVTVVVAAGEVISISKAQCISNTWRITGTSTVTANNSITFYRTATVPTSPTTANTIGSATVTSVGAFDFRPTATSTCNSPISMKSTVGTVKNNQAVVLK